MTYAVSSGTLNPTQLNSTFSWSFVNLFIRLKKRWMWMLSTNNEIIVSPMLSPNVLWADKLLPSDTPAILEGFRFWRLRLSWCNSRYMVMLNRNTDISSSSFSNSSLKWTLFLNITILFWPSLVRSESLFYTVSQKKSSHLLSLCNFVKS